MSGWLRVPTMVWLIVGLLAAAAASAQNYPTKPIRIVTSTPGGGNDATARLIAQGIAEPIGQPVIVENRSGVQAPEIVAKAPADGYTLLVLGDSVWSGTLVRPASYDPITDLAPVTQVSREVYVLAVHPSVPVKTVKELIALAKSRPGDLNFGTATIGGASHFASELFKSMARIDIVRVSYKGSGQLMTAILSGEVQILFSQAPVILPLTKPGKLRALAVSSAEPSALAPGLPPVAATVPGYSSSGSTAVFAPAKTPAPVIARLNQEIVRYLNRSEVKERFLASGGEVVASPPDQLGALVKLDMAKNGKLVKELGIKAD